MPADTVWFSYQDRRHRLWAITSAGPAFFNGKSFVPVAGAQSAGPLNRQGLAEDAQGTLWLGGSSGVFALDTRPCHPAPGLAPAQRHGGGSGRSSTRAANLWIGTSEGLERYAGGALAPSRSLPARRR